MGATQMQQSDQETSDNLERVEVQVRPGVVRIYYRPRNKVVHSSRRDENAPMFSYFKPIMLEHAEPGGKFIETRSQLKEYCKEKGLWSSLL